MRTGALFLLLLQCLVTGVLQAGEQAPRVTVAAPYLELHTGPGRGYPVFHVIERGAGVEVLKRKTDWFKVRSETGVVGWVDRAQLEQTLRGGGERTRVAEAAMDDFAARRWEMGVLVGEFGGAAAVSAYGGYGLTRNLSVELSLTNVLGDYSDSVMLNARLIAQPFPDWRYSPYFGLGAGVIRIEPSATLVQTEDRSDQVAHAGVGLRAYLTRRFLLRLEYNSYVVFTSTDDNEEIEEWKAGFSAFF